MSSNIYTGIHAHSAVLHFGRMPWDRSSGKRQAHGKLKLNNSLQASAEWSFSQVPESPLDAIVANVLLKGSHSMEGRMYMLEMAVFLWLLCRFPPQWVLGCGMHAG